NLVCSEMKMNARTTKYFGDFIYGSQSSLRMKRKYDKFCEIGEVKIANKDKIFLTFVEARDIIRNIPELKSSTTYFKYKNRPNNVPSNPDKYYREEWVSWDDFCNYQPKI